MPETTRIEIPVRFDGTVTVDVPKDAPNPIALAEHLALSRLLAVASPEHNPDAPELDSYETWADTVSEVEDPALEAVWDAAAVDGVSGNWVTFPIAD